MISIPRTVLSFCLILFLLPVVQAQESTKNTVSSYQKNEIGFSFGFANYQGDLEEPVFFSLNNSNPFFGVNLRHHVNDRWAFRINGNYGKLTGADANYNKPVWRKERDFSFKANAIELSGQVEFEPFGHRRYQHVSKGQFKQILSPYFFIGFGVASIKNETDYNLDNPISDPVSIAMDMDQDEDIHLMLPGGVGIRYDVNRDFTLGLEMGFRNSFSDYLDGVSAAGNPDANDWYMFTGITASYRLSRGSDRDYDGIPDNLDTCPDEPGSESLKGCPETLEAMIQDTEIEEVAVVEEQPIVEEGMTPRVVVTNQITEADRVTLKEAAYDIQFETNSYKFKPESYIVLEKIRQILARNPSSKLLIGGHTDGTGENLPNLILSSNRAKACFDWLVSKDIPATRLTYVGYGESKPKSTNDTEEGRALNRRVEFDISN